MTGMVPPVLRARDGVEVEVDPDTVFPCPLDGFEEVGPTCPREEWFAIPYLDRPEREGQSDPVQPCCCDLCKVIFGLSVSREEE